MELNDEYIIEYFSNRKRWTKRNVHREIYEYLVSRYSDTNNAHESLYRILHNLTCAPICVICGKQAKFIRVDTGYLKYCSRKCMNKDSEYRNKLSIAVKNGMHNMTKENFDKMKLNISIAQKNLWKDEQYRKNQTILIKKAYENMSDENKYVHKKNTSIGTKLGIKNMSDEAKNNLEIKDD